MIVVARLAATRPVPRMTPPMSTTMRVPKRSDSAPHAKAAPAMNRKSRVTALEMPVRDQPVASAIDGRNTASENMAPMPMQVINMPAPTTTHPYDRFHALLHGRTAARRSLEAGRQPKSNEKSLMLP